MADAVTKLREICMALPDVSERAHFGEGMFYIGQRPIPAAPITKLRPRRPRCARRNRGMRARTTTEMISTRLH